MSTELVHVNVPIFNSADVLLLVVSLLKDNRWKITILAPFLHEFLHIWKMSNEICIGWVLSLQLDIMRLPPASSNLHHSSLKPTWHAIRTSLLWKLCAKWLVATISCFCFTKSLLPVSTEVENTLTSQYRIVKVRMY
ncbi:hypothetical protein SDC9_154637 [bioreactor metagenome]|uniref:Uncharacterized protein n=1 Tax=bioreactor metagenome TaxID=1076179 RepID=A0A645EZA7_9ZZZZ